jgi:hypothetical protein
MADASTEPSAKRHRGGELITLPVGAFPLSAPSIFISFVSPKTSKAHIAKAIQQHWGIPSNIKIDWPEDGNDGNDDTDEAGERKTYGGKAYITMNTWYRTPTAREARLALLRKELVKLNLNDGYYFKCFILIDRHGH